MSPEKRYTILRIGLVLSVFLLVFSVPRVLAVSPVQSDAGSRYKICFTASDVGGSTTKCMFVTVVGACTPATADVNIDGKVDVFDLALVAFHYGEARVVPEPYNPMDSPSVGLDDLVCVASEWGATNPV